MADLGLIRWVMPPDPPMTARHWRTLDQHVTAELRAVDRALSAWAGWQPKTEAVDQLLDERLVLRPPDVMATWPGRSS